MNTVQIIVIGLATTLWLSAAVLAATPVVDGPFKDCDDCPEMLIVPKGEFIMGANSRHTKEGPARRVQVMKPFAMSQFEITFDNWQACVDGDGCSRTPGDHKWGRGDRPVINITWTEAKNYTDWLTNVTGHRYRLPTEAEWEYAARAGTTTNYSWGDIATAKSLANCRDCGPKISRQTEPVGSFKPNPWGFYDMHGNTWEWMQDCWNETHDGAPKDTTARLDGDCRQRVIRSGSWYYFSKNLRSSWRHKNDYRAKSYGIGLRVVREIEHTQF